MIDWPSFNLGAIIAGVVVFLVMVAAAYYFVMRAYELGWNDCNEGRGVDGGAEESS